MRLGGSITRPSDTWALEPLANVRVAERESSRARTQRASKMLGEFRAKPDDLRQQLGCTTHERWGILQLRASNRQLLRLNIGAWRRRSLRSYLLQPLPQYRLIPPINRL